MPYGGSQARSLIRAVVPAYTTATATPDPSCVFSLHHSSLQRQLLNPLSEVRDRTLNLMVPSWIVSAAPRWELLFILIREAARAFPRVTVPFTLATTKECPGCSESASASGLVRVEPSTALEVCGVTSLAF